jgi:hypothetical protein
MGRASNGDALAAAIDRLRTLGLNVTVVGELPCRVSVRANA